MDYYKKCIIEWVTELDDLEVLELIYRFIRRYLS